MKANNSGLNVLFQILQTILEAELLLIFPHSYPAVKYFALCWQPLKEMLSFS